jgi:hypothetical protein
MKLRTALRNGVLKIYNSQIRSGVEDGCQWWTVNNVAGHQLHEEQSFCEANTRLANYPHFTEPQGSLRGHTTPPLVPILR